MLKDFFTQQLKLNFAGQPHITRGELFDFYRSYEPNLKEATFGWRVYALKAKNLIKPIRKGVYTLSVKAEFHPLIDPRLKEFATKLSQKFPLVRYCVWNTKWLNEWMIHQPGKFLMMVEAEASVVESVFYFLKDNNYKNVFINPNNDLVERYIYEESETLIIKSLVSKAPITMEGKISVPLVEKLLVDLYIDKKLFTPFQGNELVQIYNYVYKHYSLNITTLLAYAKRRTNDRELLDFIKRNTQLTELLSL